MNILLVLPVPAFLSPFVMAPVVLTRDYPTMMVITLGCTLLFVYAGSRQGKKIGRLAGTVLLAMYIAYTASLIIG